MADYEKVWVSRGDDRDIEVRAVTSNSLQVTTTFCSDSHGAPRLRRFVIEGDEVLPGDLRRLPVAPLYEALSDADPFCLFLAGFDLEPTESVASSRHRGTPDRFYASWAARYVQKCRAGARNPVAELAAEHGIAPRSLHRIIYRARERGLLAGTQPGRPGGHLTARAIDALTETL